MSTYTRDQIRQAMYDLFAKDNGRTGQLTDEQYAAIGMVTIALQDYDKNQTTPAGDTATPQ